MLSGWWKICWTVRVALIFWAALTLAVTIRVAVSKPTSQSVVPIYQAAGERWSASESLYSVDTGLDVYRNPPVFAALFSCFNILPVKLAAILWRGLGIAIFLLGLRRFTWAFTQDLSIVRFGTLFTLAGILAIPAINNGQVNLLLAGCVLHGMAACQRQRWWEAAAWLSGGISLKLYPIAIAMLAALVMPQKLLPRLGTLTAVGMALPFILQDPYFVLDQYREFVSYLGSDDRTHAALSRVPRDWTVIVRTWLDVIPEATVTKFISIAAGGLAAGYLFFARIDQTTKWRGAAILGTGWMTIFGPATEANTYTLFAGLAAWQVVQKTTSVWTRWLSRVGYLALSLTVLRGLFPNDWQFQILGPQPFGAVLLIASSIAMNAVTVSLPGSQIILARVDQGRWARTSRLPVSEPVAAEKS